MAIADRAGLPVAAWIASASPAEIKVVEETIHHGFLDVAPERLIGDKAYDSDGLDEQLWKERQIELISPVAVNNIISARDGHADRSMVQRWLGRLASDGWATGFALRLACCSERRATARRRPDSGPEAGRYSGSAPGVVMKATDLGLGHDPPPARRFNRARPGSVVIEGLMRPRVVVVREVLTQNAPQVSFVNHEDVVEALSPDRSDQAFDEWTPL